MNETLSNEEIKNIEGSLNEISEEDMDSSYDGFTGNEMQKALNTIEAKNAQIKQLVEALEIYSKKPINYLCGLCESNHKIAEQALSTIPDVEGYRLEGEYLNKSKEWHLASTAVNYMPYDEYKKLQKAWQDSFLAYVTSEAHREKVKNEL